MSLVTQISSLATRLGTEFKSVYSKTGNIASLTTGNKNNLVSAINELQGLIAAIPALNDTTSSSGGYYSSAKVVALLAALKAEILGGASAAYDTLKELADLIASDESGIASLTTAIGTKVDYSTAQTLTSGQQSQARSNIAAAAASDVTTLSTAVGDTTTNFVTTFEAALT